MVSCVLMRYSVNCNKTIVYSRSLNTFDIEHLTEHSTSSNVILLDGMCFRFCAMRTDGQADRQTGRQTDRGTGGDNCCKLFDSCVGYGQLVGGRVMAMLRTAL